MNISTEGFQDPTLTRLTVNADDLEWDSEYHSGLGVIWSVRGWQHARRGGEGADNGEARHDDDEEAAGAGN